MIRILFLDFVRSAITNCSEKRTDRESRKTEPQGTDNVRRQISILCVYTVVLAGDYSVTRRVEAIRA